MLLTLIVFLAVLSLLVFVHELGHYLAARKAGIRIEEVGFGLPPRIWGVKKGETIYSLNWLPIGGFVKLYGEDEAELTSDGVRRLVPSEVEGTPPRWTNDAFFAKPKKVRAAVLLAGVFMNTLLAVAVFYSFLLIAGFKTELPLFFDHKFFAVNQTNKTELIVVAVSANSPAAQKKISIPSKIITVDGKKMDNGEQFTQFINENKGKEISLELENLSTFQNYKVEVTPRVSPPKKEGPLGIAFSPSRVAVLSYTTPAEKLFSGFTYSFNLLAYNLEVLARLIGVSFQQKTAAPVGEAVSGPVGILEVFAQLIKIPNLKERALQGLNLIGLISISLAFFNILPFPALDGGRLLFVMIEAAIGRKVKPRLESMAHQIGMVVLLTLIALVTINDLLRIFKQ